jgi:glycosyltransferase involved in cell wall biosynthesis
MTGSGLILHTEASRGWGGQEMRTLEELRHMPRFGFDTALAAPAASRIYHAARQEGIAAYAVDFSSKGDLGSFSRLLQLIARLKPTVVNTHSSTDSWMAGLACKLKRVPVVLRTRHISTPIGSAASYRFLADAVLTTSETIRHHIIARGLAPQKVFTLPTGIEPDRFAFSLEQRRKIRLSLSVSDDQVLVGNVCILRSWKGLDFFVETAARMPDRYRFVVVGDGPQNQNLKTKARELKAEKRIIFTGYQPMPEHYFSAMDVYFFTSFASEGIPQSLLQALCAGLPVVACPTPSIKEVLDGVDGARWVDYGQTNAAAEAIADVANQHTALDRPSSAAGRHAMLTHYTTDAMLQRLRQLYAQLGIVP